MYKTPLLPENTGAVARRDLVCNLVHEDIGKFVIGYHSPNHHDGFLPGFMTSLLIRLPSENHTHILLQLISN